MKVKSFIKREIVLIISFLLAFFSMFIGKPGVQYMEVIDFKTLSLLFCLMVVTEGFKKIGIFDLLAQKLSGTVHTVKGISVMLCILCFFSSMLITNDVALITFVPFTILVLRRSGGQRYITPIVIIETVAANLGSMLTPVGNPQNLFLFSNFNTSLKSFINAIFPYALLSLVLVVAAASIVGKKEQIASSDEKIKIKNKYSFAIYIVLFLLSLLTVFRIVPFIYTLFVCLLAVIFMDVKVLKNVDYSLLLTFVFLFIFIGNLGEISFVNSFLENVLSGREVPVAILLSQVFSNVPTAILLSGFTDQAEALLIGTNLGGLGTLIASMASLISFKFVAKENVSVGKYVFHFTWINLVFLGCNVLLWVFLS